MVREQFDSEPVVTQGGRVAGARANEQVVTQGGRVTGKRAPEPVVTQGGRVDGKRTNDRPGPRAALTAAE